MRRESVQQLSVGASLLPSQVSLRWRREVGRVLSFSQLGQSLVGSVYQVNRKGSPTSAERHHHLLGKGERVCTMDKRINSGSRAVCC